MKRKLIDQMGRYDADILDAIENHRIEVDQDKGIVFGNRVNMSGKRNPIGHINYDIRKHHFLIGKKCVMLYSKRTVYLAYVGPEKNNREMIENKIKF